MIGTIVITRHPLHVMAENANRSRRLLIGIGIALCLVGLLALILPVAAGIGVDLMVGWLLLAVGVLAAAFSLSGGERRHRWRGTAVAIGAAIVGLFLLLKPVTGTVVLASLLAVYFLVDGIIGIMATIQARRSGAAVAIGLGAAVSLILGMIMLAMLPSAAPWLLGVLVGVYLLADGVFSLVLAANIERDRQRIAGDAAS